MYSDGSSFYKRASIFFVCLKNGTYPNASRLAELAKCSRNTAQRTVERLRRDFNVPLGYDEEKHGYYLKDHSFELPLLVPGKDELTALLLMRDLSSVLDSKDLQEKIDSLWYQYASRNPSLAGELQRLAGYFSSDSTVIGRLADWGVLDLLSAAADEKGCQIVYRSPWRHKEEKTYLGRIARVHFSDGVLYVLFACSDGRRIVLNASFMKDFQVLDYDPLKGEKAEPAPYFGEGFGIWTNEKLEEVEISILPPASVYYASQIWHEDQQDTWDGEMLRRSLKSALSPELVRRILSLGAFVAEVKPAALKAMVLSEAKKLTAALS